MRIFAQNVTRRPRANPHSGVTSLRERQKSQPAPCSAHGSATTMSPLPHSAQACGRNRRRTMRTTSGCVTRCLTLSAAPTPRSYRPRAALSSVPDAEYSGFCIRIEDLFLDTPEAYRGHPDRRNVLSDVMRSTYIYWHPPNMVFRRD